MNQYSTDLTEHKISSPLVLEILALLHNQELSSVENEGLCAHLNELLTELDLTHSQTERAYVCFLNLLLEACISHIPADSTLFSQLKIVQAQISPPISIVEVGVIFQSVQRAAERLRQAGVLSTEQVSLVLSPILFEYSNNPIKNDSSYLKQKLSATSSRAIHKSNEYEAPQQLPQRRNLRNGSNVTNIKKQANKAAPEKNTSDVHKIQENYIRQIRSVVSHFDNFGGKLESDIESICELDPYDDMEQYHLSVMNTLEQLKREHDELRLKVNSARTYLSVIESGSQQLVDELDQARVLSFTDELTALPNRRAFLAKLEVEVSRVKRYDNPLTLVIVDLDHFKMINDRFGHSAGDEILRAYAEKVFTLFRHHDLVARYGGEEFVILFPNTNANGVLLALQKIQSQCEDLSVKTASGNIPLPTFSAGAAEYQQGESADNFIERADNALYRAKRLGRGRVEVNYNTVTKNDDEIYTT